MGDHTILSEIHFVFEIVINKDGLDGTKEDKMISRVVSHELLHVYQMVKQLESGISSHFGPETVLNALPQHPTTSQTGLGYWDYFLNFLGSSSNLFEIILKLFWNPFGEFFI